MNENNQKSLDQTSNLAFLDMKVSYDKHLAIALNLGFKSVSYATQALGKYQWLKVVQREVVHLDMKMQLYKEGVHYPRNTKPLEGFKEYTVFKNGMVYSIQQDKALPVTHEKKSRKIIKSFIDVEGVRFDRLDLKTYYHTDHDFQSFTQFLKSKPKNNKK